MKASSADSPTAPAPDSTSDGAGVFVGNAGPAFDPGAVASDPAAAPVEPPQLLPEWDQKVVEGILTAQGAVVHTLVGVSDDDWIYLEHELGAIAPPLTRILNRYDATRAAAAAGDELAVMVALGGYVSRSYMIRRAVLGAADAQPEPITGVHAPAGTDGANDFAAQAARGEVPDQWTTSS